MKYPTSHFGGLSFLTLALVGCASGDPQAVPDPRGLNLVVGALTLPSLSEVCYDVRVTNAANGAGDIVWSRGTPGLNGGTRDPDAICSSRFGNGAGGAVSYVGPCDASGQEDPEDPAGERTNSVTLWFDGVYAANGDYLDPEGDDGWQNPCVNSAGEEVGCRLNVLCEENADARVTFDFTILRQANQGFFDVAVNFEDIFCSAKLDTCYDTGTIDEEPIALLFGAGTERDWTGVFGLACTAGTGTADTTLLYSHIKVTCDDGTTTTVFELDPTAGPGNASVIEGDYTLHYGVYRGFEDLDCGVGPCNKSYWNIAFSLEDLEAVGGDCDIALAATATDGNEGFEAGLPTAAGGFWPYIEVATAVTTDGNAFCQENALNEGTVVTTYHGDPDPLTDPETMCWQLDDGYVGPVVGALCDPKELVHVVLTGEVAPNDPVAGAVWELDVGGANTLSAVTGLDGMATFIGQDTPGTFTLIPVANFCTSGAAVLKFEGSTEAASNYTFAYTGTTVTIEVTVSCQIK